MKKSVTHGALSIAICCTCGHISVRCASSVARRLLCEVHHLLRNLPARRKARMTFSGLLSQNSVATSSLTVTSAVKCGNGIAISVAREVAVEQRARVDLLDVTSTPISAHCACRIVAVSWWITEPRDTGRWRRAVGHRRLSHQLLRLLEVVGVAGIWSGGAVNLPFGIMSFATSATPP